MKNINAIYATKIRKEMERQAFSPAKLAKAAGVGTSTVHKTLAGQQHIKLDLLHKVALALNTTVSDLTDLSINKSLTPVPRINEAILLFNDAIWQGDIGYQRVKHLVTANYKVVYADLSRGDANRGGPTLKKEIELNELQRKPTTSIHSATTIMDFVVLTHMTIFSEGDLHLNGLPNRSGGQKGMQTEIIDFWKLTRKIDEIMAGRAIKIDRRWIKVVSEERVY